MKIDELNKGNVRMQNSIEEHEKKYDLLVREIESHEKNSVESGAKYNEQQYLIIKEKLVFEEERIRELWAEIENTKINRAECVLAINACIGRIEKLKTAIIKNNERKNIRQNIWNRVRKKKSLCKGMIAGNYHVLIGLSEKGDIFVTGQNDRQECEARYWKDIVSVNAGEDYAVGLREDGTVVAVGENKYGQCDVDDWHDVIAVATSGSHTVGLREDGTVVATGLDDDGQCDVSKWNDVVSIAATEGYTIGLKSNGSVVVCGEKKGKCDVDDWKDVIAIDVVHGTVIGVKADGTVVIYNSMKERKFDTNNWRLFDSTKIS